MAAEGLGWEGRSLDMSKRQWGRDRLAAEGRSARLLPSAPLSSVNGAATVWPRKAAAGFVG